MPGHTYILMYGELCRQQCIRTRQQTGRQRWKLFRTVFAGGRNWIQAGCSEESHCPWNVVCGSYQSERSLAYYFAEHSRFVFGVKEFRLYNRGFFWNTHFDGKCRHAVHLVFPPTGENETSVWQLPPQANTFNNSRTSRAPSSQHKYVFHPNLLSASGSAGGPAMSSSGRMRKKPVIGSAAISSQVAARNTNQALRRPLGVRRQKNKAANKRTRHIPRDTNAAREPSWLRKRLHPWFENPRESIHALTIIMWQGVEDTGRPRPSGHSAEHVIPPTHPHASQVILVARRLSEQHHIMLSCLQGVNKPAPASSKRLLDSPSTLIRIGFAIPRYRRS